MNSTCPTSVASTLDTNKYKLLMKASIEDLDIIKGNLQLFNHSHCIYTIVEFDF